MMNIMNPPADWSTLKKLIWLRGTPINGGEELTVSGTPPLSLPNSLGKPLKAWSVDLLPYQEGTGDPSPDNVRPIHGTNKLTIYTDSKYGGLVEWNQYITGPATKASTKVLPSGTQIISGHKYLLIFNGSKISEQQNSSIYLYIGKNSGVYATVGVGSYKFYTATSTVTADGTANANANSVWAYLTADCNWESLNLYDLTRMFGAGNEPTTLAEFTALFDQPYYAYNAGQQMTVDQVNGAQYSPAVLTLPQTVYTGTIGSEGGESRWGEVDLGTLTWIYNNTEYSYGYFQAMISGKKQAEGNNFLCESYANASGNCASLQNNQIARRNNTSSNICIRNDMYTDVESFVQSLQGIKLIYELATPTTFAVPSVTIPTPQGNATTWATAEDGTVDSMEVTYVGKA